MARIVIADDGIVFDGRTPETEPLGGVESSLVALAEELAARGHQVLVRNMCPAQIRHKGVDWAPLHGGGQYAGLPEDADLYIANRGDKLIPLLPAARRRVFWVHNPAQYLLKARYLVKLFRARPTIVFLGDYHATTCPRWVPDGGRVIIPYGIADGFRTARPASEAPPPRAVFTSNALRSLDWLLDLWADKIHPAVPGSELHIFSGAATYGAVGVRKSAAMEGILERARNMADAGVILRGPVPKRELVDELRAARVMLYRGDVNETFCLAVGEAQAMGVPAVVQNLGSVGERVIDGVTGTVAADDEAFVAAATGLLNEDDTLWKSQHGAAIEHQRQWGWCDAAAEFERLLP